MVQNFPPVPKWHPPFAQPIDRIIDRLRYYSNGRRDFAVFANGTCAVLDQGLAEAAAIDAAKTMLAQIFHAHPDMHPTPMDDGNILIRYNHPAVNIVLADVVEAHWAEIDARHQDALAESEVMITPLGNNVFDDFGKKALFGRCYMFMDAQDPKVVRIERATAA